MFADDMISQIEKPKDTTRKLLELINEFSEFPGYKINAQKSLAFLYTNKENSERKIKEIIPFTTATERIKYLGTNLSNEMKELYAENHKTMMSLDWKNQCCENDYTTQSNLQIQCNLYQIANGIFHRTRIKKFTVCMETQKTPNS